MGTQKSQRGRGGRRGRGRGGCRGGFGGRPAPNGGAKRRRAGLGKGDFDDYDGFISLDQFLDEDVYGKPRPSRKKYDYYEDTTPKFSIEQPKRKTGTSAVYRLPIEFVLATETKIDLTKPMVKTNIDAKDQELPQFHLLDHERDGLGNSEAEPNEENEPSEEAEPSEVLEPSEVHVPIEGPEEVVEADEIDSHCESENAEDVLEEELELLSDSYDSAIEMEECIEEEDLSEDEFYKGGPLTTESESEDESFVHVQNAFQALDPSSATEEGPGSMSEKLMYDSDALSLLDSDFDVSAQGLDSDDIDRIRRLDPLGADPRAKDWRMGDDDGEDMDSAEELLRELINSGRQSGYSHMDEYLDNEFGALPNRPKRLGKKARRRLAREMRAGNTDAIDLPPSKHLWIKYPVSMTRQELFSELSEFVLCSQLDSDDEEANYNGLGKCPAELCLPPANSMDTKEQQAMAETFGLAATKRKLGKTKYLVLVSTKRSHIPPRSGKLGALLQQNSTYTRSDLNKMDGLSRELAKSSKSKDKAKNSAHVKEGTIVGENAEKIASDNFGHRLLMQMGWSEGQGLGSDRAGIVAPVSATMKTSKRGVGLSLG